MPSPLHQHNDTRWSKSTVYSGDSRPIDIPSSAYWTCSACNVPHRFRLPSEVRPLGRLRCPLCRVVIESLTQITGLSSLDIINGPQLLVSLLPGSTHLPKSIFGTICCKCGRSHLRKTFEHVPRPESQHVEHRGEVSTKDKFRKKAMIAYTKIKYADSLDSFQDDKRVFEKLMDEEEFRQQFGPYPVWSSKHDQKNERMLYKVTFNKACGCQDHVTCPSCPKFRVLADGEWSSEVIGAEYEGSFF